MREYLQSRIFELENLYNDLAIEEDKELSKSKVYENNDQYPRAQLGFNSPNSNEDVADRQSNSFDNIY